MLQSLADVPIAVVDTETTGVSAAFGDRIIEVGIARIEGGRIVAEYQQLIDPGRRISAGVSALTGISQQMVAGKPRFVDQLPAMLSILEGAAILGHNVGFDLSFLNAEFRRAALSISQALGTIPILDTVRIARRRFGRGGNSLPVLSRRLGVEPVASHRALADAKTTAAVFERLLEPLGGYAISLCDAQAHQGGAIDLARIDGQSVLPLELEEALEFGRPVKMDYLDARGSQTQRVIQPLHIRRHNGELLLVAYCHLREDRRTFKLERIVRLIRSDRLEIAAATMAELGPKPQIRIPNQ
jgi:DNA polymerase III epsilon subunit family exonuclease